MEDDKTWKKGSGKVAKSVLNIVSISSVGQLALKMFGGWSYRYLMYMRRIHKWKLSSTYHLGVTSRSLSKLEWTDIQLNSMNIWADNSVIVIVIENMYKD